MKLKKLALVLVFAMLLSCAAFAYEPAVLSWGELSGITADGEDLLLTDTYNKVIWRISGNVPEQVAGAVNIADVNGEPVAAYVDAAAEAAYFAEPWAIVPFMDGWAVSDTANNVIRYYANDEVRTLSGSGKAGLTNGRAGVVQFNGPTGLAADEAGNLYIADTCNNVIRKMDTKGNVTTYVKNLVEPTGLCWADGALYAAETGANRIVKIVSGKTEVVAGRKIAAEEDTGVYLGGFVNGAVSAAEFDHPMGVTVAPDGTLYVSDTGNRCVRVIADGRVNTIAASAKTVGGVVRPLGLLVSGDYLYVADGFSRNLQVYDIRTGFSDVKEDAWYAAAVAAAAERGLVSGMGDGTFAPDAGVTRAMFVTMVGNLQTYFDGSTVIGGDASFPDVAEGSWYENAACWAADEKLVYGDENGNFCPNVTISREQMVTLLYRYAQMIGLDVTVGEDTNILDYDDALSVSSWAVSAVQWACGAGILHGMDDGTLAPAATVTRAQAVQLLIAFMALCEA